MTTISLLTNDGALKLSEQGMNFPIEKVTKTVSLFTSCLGSGQLNDQNTGVRRQRHNALPVRFPHKAEEFLPSTVELLERKYNAEKEMGFLSHTHSQIKMAPRKERFLISGPNNRKNTAPPLFLSFFFNVLHDAIQIEAPKTFFFDLYGLYLWRCVRLQRPFIKASPASCHTNSSIGQLDY